MNPNYFRIRDVKNGCFEYHQVGCRQFLIGLNGEVYDGEGNPYDEEYIINRWCGLTTYLDDYIFEGDIVEYYLGSGFSTYGPYVATVEFYNYGWCLREKQCMPQPLHQIEDIRVIGNIYDGLNEDEK